MGDYFSSVSTEMFRKFTSTALALALLAALISASPAVGEKEKTRHDIILSHHEPGESNTNLDNTFKITTSLDIPVVLTITWEDPACNPIGIGVGTLDNIIGPKEYVYCQQFNCGNIKVQASTEINGILKSCYYNDKQANLTVIPMFTGILVGDPKLIGCSITSS